MRLSHPAQTRRSTPKPVVELTAGNANGGLSAGPLSHFPFSETDQARSGS